MIYKFNFKFLENKTGSIFIFQAFYYITCVFLFLLPLILSFVSDIRWDTDDFYNINDEKKIFSRLLFIFLVLGVIFSFYYKKSKKNSIKENAEDSTIVRDIFISKEYWPHLFEYFRKCYCYAYENKQITKFRFFFLYVLSAFF